MKIVTSREMIRPDGTVTKIVIEENVSNPQEARDHLELMGFYPPRNLGQRLVRFLAGARTEVW
jgi:hypothetical protein